MWIKIECLTCCITECFVTIERRLNFVGRPAFRGIWHEQQFALGSVKTAFNLNETEEMQLATIASPFFFNILFNCVHRAAAPILALNVFTDF